MICGWISEETAQTNKKVSQISTALGWVLLLTTITVVCRRFISVINQASQDDGKEGPPWWVFAIVWCMFLLYSAFGIIHLVHMRKQWKDTTRNDVVFNRRIEGAYTTTSMVSKILLVVFLASGLFARDTV
jgi:uncharacterized membrane protein